MAKKIILTLIFFVLFNFFLLNNNLPIYAKSTYYARITQDNVSLYNSALAEKDNIIFNLPKTYFVKILSKENDLFYRVEYLEKEGYIKTSDIKFISGTPQKPYANNLSFRVFAREGLSLRKTPYSTDGSINLVTTIPFLETNLVYYGSRAGEESVIYKGDEWYYCKYIAPTKTYEGYVYSPYCDMLSKINDNIEEFEYIDEPNLTEKEEVIEQIDNISKLEMPAQVALIALASLPCIAIVYFLFKPSFALESKASPTKKKKHKIKKLKHSDYFEIDDDYFGKNA